MFKERTEKAKEKLIEPDSSDEDSIVPCESLLANKSEMSQKYAGRQWSQSVTVVYYSIFYFQVKRLVHTEPDTQPSLNKNLHEYTDRHTQVRSNSSSFSPGFNLTAVPPSHLQLYHQCLSFSPQCFDQWLPKYIAYKIPGNICININVSFFKHNRMKEINI